MRMTALSAGSRTVPLPAAALARWERWCLPRFQGSVSPAPGEPLLPLELSSAIAAGSRLPADPGSCGRGVASGTPGTETPGIATALPRASGTPGTGTPGTATTALLRASGTPATGTPGIATALLRASGTPGTGTPGMATTLPRASGTPGTGTPGTATTALLWASGTPGTGTPGMATTLLGASGTPGTADPGACGKGIASGTLGTGTNAFERQGPPALGPPRTWQHLAASGSTSSPLTLQSHGRTTERWEVPGPPGTAPGKRELVLVTGVGAENWCQELEPVPVNGTDALNQNLCHEPKPLLENWSQ
ncbi:hypothetical protein WISP_107916 [Willisornis vidua]|uniref:Uncharacterized protein n=1 Tax=Willisornis vidua TaxID=1566151 RepID=A0ABQ9D1C6_9PASS|nr:hypothetical protein WISP_107916 [Willisornis vidua]